MAKQRSPFGGKRQKSPAEGASPSPKQPTGGPAKAAMRKPKGAPIRPAPLSAAPGNPPPGGIPSGPQVRSLPHAPMMTEPLKTPPGAGGGQDQMLMALLQKILGGGGGALGGGRPGGM